MHFRRGEYLERAMQCSMGFVTPTLGSVCGLIPCECLRAVSELAGRTGAKRQVHGGDEQVA